MQNDYTTLHKNLDTKIAELQDKPFTNMYLIQDLKKQKLRLKDKMVGIVNDDIDTFVKSEQKRNKKLLDNMIHRQKRSDKKRRKERKKKIQYAIRRSDKVSLSG